MEYLTLRFGRTAVTPIENPRVGGSIPPPGAILTNKINYLG